MAQIAYRANLLSGHFPFYSAYHGQTVIVPGRDQAFQNQVVIGQDSEDKDRGIPQLYYCHNVMPTHQGVQSIGFVDRVLPYPGAMDFNEIFIIRDEDENKFLFSPAAGSNYVFRANDNAWTKLSGPIASNNGLVTWAYINGKTYIFYENVNIYEYDEIANTLDIVPIVGITPADIKGICSSSGFLIAWDDFTVYRSQAVDILDFTPDFSLGSGSSIPQDIAGRIIACLPISNGFIIYTTKNAVSATWSQNIRYPFNYNEITGSAGIIHPRHVAWQNNMSVHYAWTQAGLQKVDKVKAQIVYPELTDFLTAKIFEDYDITTDEFLIQQLSGQVSVKIAVAGKRYLIISYGVTVPFTHALVHDLALKRWGKIKIEHVAAFEFYLPNLFGEVTWDMLEPFEWDDLEEATWDELATGFETFENPKELLAFIQVDGTVKTVNFDDVHTNDDGVAVFGRYQFIRERLLSLEEIEVENVAQVVTNFTLKILTSISGKAFARKTTPYKVHDEPALERYLSHVEGKNHSLRFAGTFYLTFLGLKFVVKGHK